MADQLSFAPMRALDSNGDPVAGALAYFYLTGTTTPVIVYSDATNETPLPNPMTADAAGLFPQVFPSPGQQIKVVVTDPDDAVLPGFPIDPAPLHSTGGSSAAGVSFSPVTDIPKVNVQDAIEQVQANIAAVGEEVGGLGTLAEMDLTDLIIGQGDWSEGTATDDGLISPEKLLGAIPTLLTLITPGEVGSLVWASHDGAVSYGGIVAGSTLQPTASSWSITKGGGGGTNQAPRGDALSGTWQCLGRASAATTTPGVSTIFWATLWLRIA